MTSPVTMISHLKSTAPYFNGQALNLRSFLTDFETLADEAKLDAAQKIKYLPRYTSYRTQQYWEQQDEYTAGTDWDAFKAKIISLYPLTYDSLSYETEDLEALVHRSKGIPIGSLEDYGRYHRNFSQIATWLQTNKA
ncbi:hypothetical protein SISNIDRAFT_482462, partial [Sistotremastrum niveocremeum HHB9708]